MHQDPTTPQSPPSEEPNRKKPKLYGPGRPRVLDDAKRREICALISGGCGFREAAKYVHCSVNTIRREAERNTAFAEQLRHSEAHAQLSPLRAMQNAIGTHWRAAAWFLERAFPDRFARPNSGGFGAREARDLMTEVVNVISSEVTDPVRYGRIEKRVRGAFEYHIRTACDRRRTTKNLRRAMQHFEDKEHREDPLAQLGIEVPDFEELMRSIRAPTAAYSTGPASASAQRASTSVGRGSPDPALTPTEGLPNTNKPSTAPTAPRPTKPPKTALRPDPKELVFLKMARDELANRIPTGARSTTPPTQPIPNNL